MLAKDLGSAYDRIITLMCLVVICHHTVIKTNILHFYSLWEKIMISHCLKAHHSDSYGCLFSLRYHSASTYSLQRQQTTAKIMCICVWRLGCRGPSGNGPLSLVENKSPTTWRLLSSLKLSFSICEVFGKLFCLWAVSDMMILSLIYSGFVFGKARLNP